MRWKSIQIRIDEPPKGKASIRGGRGVYYTAAPTEQAMRRFALAAGQAYDGPTLQAPITMELVAVLPRPKRLMRRADPEHRVEAPVKPDLSNVQKLVEDSIQRCRWCGMPRARCRCGLFYPLIGDDAWIVDVRESKFYGAITDRATKACEEPHVFLALTGRI